jgi:hypothetical protein
VVVETIENAVGAIVASFVVLFTRKFMKEDDDGEA